MHGVKMNKISSFCKAGNSPLSTPSTPEGSRKLQPQQPEPKTKQSSSRIIISKRNEKKPDKDIQVAAFSFKQDKYKSVVHSHTHRTRTLTMHQSVRTYSKKLLDVKSDKDGLTVSHDLHYCACAEVSQLKLWRESYMKLNIIIGMVINYMKLYIKTIPQ